MGWGALKNDEGLVRSREKPQDGRIKMGWERQKGKKNKKKKQIPAEAAWSF